MERIVWGQTAEGLIQASVQLTGSPGDRVCCRFQLFGVPGIIRAAGWKPRKRPEPGRWNAGRRSASSAAVNARTRLAFCITPNNPSGAMLSGADLRRLRARDP